MMNMFAHSIYQPPKDLMNTNESTPGNKKRHAAAGCPETLQLRLRMLVSALR